ncbi:hypothetical protein BY458DRAFT_430265 [Sporodiniella umbellata]|nr:hypothetical protein BY458DRAFT_430265 [Sporodiniella umbellata]
MDFSSIPFQSLLIESADSAQLLAFLNYLDEQYTNTDDEKLRFGTLQIMIPVFKAYLIRLQDLEKEKEALEQFLKPWVFRSLSQHSTVSTESTQLLEKSLAYFVGRSFLTANNREFAEDIILMILSQIVSATTDEPDFVELNPIGFIESSVNELACAEAWKQTKDYKNTVALELECCLNVLDSLIRNLNENEELIALKEVKTEEKNIWIELVFSVAVSMLSCTNSTIRSKLSHDILPNLLRWKQKTKCREKQMLWYRTLQIYGLPATNLLRLEIYGLIARFFDFYFGLEEIKETPKSGLQSNDSLARKYSSYIFKRIIDFTEKYPDTVSSEPWTIYFKWDSAQSKRYSECWEDWFLLYDIMHENVIHLVDPVLPRFEALLNADFGMDASWWILLFYRGFQNETSSVKKGLLEYIFTRQDIKTLNKLGVEQEFMFGALFKTVDSTALFAVPTQGALVSPFGENFRSFIYRLVQSFGTLESKIDFLRHLVHHLAHVVGSHAPILYAIEALADVDSVPAWGPEELKSFRFLADRHRNFNIATTKQFLRKLGTRVIVKLANPSLLSFSDIAKTISSLLNEYPINASSQEFELVRQWLEKDASKNKSSDTIQNGLKERIQTYICDLKSDDIPESVLRTQANVLSRVLVFVSSYKGAVSESRFLDLLEVFGKHLKDTSSDKAMFSRLLTLLESMWENFDHCFEYRFDFAKVLCLDDRTLLHILTRIGEFYMNIEEDNVVDTDTVQLYLSLTKRILSASTLSKDTKAKTIQSHYKKCIELLKRRSVSVVSNKEMSKPFYIQLLNVIYQAAIETPCFELDYNDNVVSLVHGLQMKRTQEAIQESCKWECIKTIICYATFAKENSVDRECFDPVELYDVAIDQLESASEMCGERIISSFGPLLAFSWEKTTNLVDRCVDLAIELIKENITQSKTFPLLIKAFISVIFQPQLLCIPQLNQDNGPIKKALNMVIETGELKPFIVAQTAKLLHDYWSTLSQEASESMQQYAPEIAKLAVFGPLRDREDQKLESALSLKLAGQEELSEAEGTAALIFTQNDYLVRVYMNNLLLRLDVKNKQHQILAVSLLDCFYRFIGDDMLFEYMYTCTAEHRLKLRVGCSSLLLIDLATEDKADEYLGFLFEITRKETVTSVRCYLEWAIIKLLSRFPDRLPLYYERLSNPDHKPNYVISLLTISFTLGTCLPAEYLGDYFEEIFVRLLPWLITNHFTIRLFGYCAWNRNWKQCNESVHNSLLENNKYLDAMGKFMEVYVDCIKFFDKIKAQFFMSRFDPVQDFNIEFIFRQMMNEFQKAFFRVNPEVVTRCPFENAARKTFYTAADPTELIGLEEEQSAPDLLQSNTEDVYQKKIMPWEMMLETDMDLTKNLVKKNRRRNDLIVVASLVDRLPNLAGLCRTCEIFNASQLVVPTLKIKEDIGFTSVSVSSERWMPMVEVPEPDVAAYLQSKREEGYVICGLEQTTTSATLGSYEFPEKCVLLLGKERQGVPADLLQMLDVTIEIPQYGITRSLNVHVSGAICIYEYTKQMQWRQQEAINAS